MAETQLAYSANSSRVAQTFETPEFEVPATVDENASLVALISMPDRVASDGDNALAVRVQYYDDVACVWKTGAAIDWVGGSKGKNGWIRPGTSDPARTFAGKKVKMTLSIPTTMSLGFTVKLVS